MVIVTATKVNITNGGESKWGVVSSWSWRRR